MSIKLENKGIYFNTPEKSEIPNFTLTCSNCGSSNCGISDTTEMGSDWTGLMGGVTLCCFDCNADYDLI